MQPTTYNVNVYCAKHIPEHRFIHKSRTLFALFKITFIVLTPTALYEASRTSVRLKQWDEKHRQCAVFRLRESVCVYSVCWAPAVGHWLPPTPWSILLDTRCQSCLLNGWLFKTRRCDGARLECQ